MRSVRTLAALAAVLLLAACSDRGATAASSDDEALGAARAELAVAANTLPAASDTDSTKAPPPLLHRLTGRALAHLTQLGATSAKEQAVTVLRTRHEALLAAREAGDPEAIRQARQQLDGTAASIVVRVFSPRVVPDVIGMVARQVQLLKARLEEAEAAGHDVTRPRMVLTRVAGMLGEARTQLQNGRPVPALLIATRAGDVLHTMFHR